MCKANIIFKEILGNAISMTTKSCPFLLNWEIWLQQYSPHESGNHRPGWTHLNCHYYTTWDVSHLVHHSIRPSPQLSNLLQIIRLHHKVLFATKTQVKGIIWSLWMRKLIQTQWKQTRKQNVACIPNRQSERRLKRK